MVKCNHDKYMLCYMLCHGVVVTKGVSAAVAALKIKCTYHLVCGLVSHGVQGKLEMKGGISMWFV
jgi:hypothetical protein